MIAWAADPCRVGTMSIEWAHCYFIMCETFGEFSLRIRPIKSQELKLIFCNFFVIATSDLVTIERPPQLNPCSPFPPGSSR